jgi:hypothetical protein
MMTIEKNGRRSILSRLTLNDLGRDQEEENSNFISYFL